MQHLETGSQKQHTNAFLMLPEIQHSLQELLQDFYFKKLSQSAELKKDYGSLILPLTE